MDISPISPTDPFPPGSVARYEAFNRSVYLQTVDVYHFKDSRSIPYTLDHVSKSLVLRHEPLQYFGLPSDGRRVSAGRQRWQGLAGCRRGVHASTEHVARRPAHAHGTRLRGIRLAGRLYLRHGGWQWGRMAG